MTKKDKSASGKRSRTRAHVLRTALDLFERQGYEATSMGQIATAADVVRQTVVNHFPRKDDLILAWGAERRERLFEALQGRASGDGTIATLLDMYDLLAEINESERTLTQALHRHYDAVTPVRAVPPAVLTAVTAGQADGTLDDRVDPDTIGQVLTAVYFDTLSRWLDEPAPWPLADALRERISLLLQASTA